MLGFRVHIQTKSRKFSTTLRAIQQERIDHELEGCREAGYEDDTSLLVGEWAFDGIGHRTEGDRRLVAQRGEDWRELYIDYRTGGCDGDQANGTEAR